VFLCAAAVGISNLRLVGERRTWTWWWKLELDWMFHWSTDRRV